MRPVEERGPVVLLIPMTAHAFDMVLARRDPRVQAVLPITGDLRADEVKALSSTLVGGRGPRYDRVCIIGRGGRRAREVAQLVRRLVPEVELRRGSAPFDWSRAVPV